jgi:hypothetical protein
MDKKAAFLPILLIAFGVGWLLTSLGIAPSIDWIWTLGIGTVGLLTLAFGGLNKFTVVVGPFLILSSAFAYLRQLGVLRFEVEAPLLVIVFGALLLVAQMPGIAIPNWIVKDSPSNQKINEKIFKI